MNVFDLMVPYCVLGVLWTGIAFGAALLALGIAFFLSVAFGHGWG